ncbi:SIMPL domain-containing protein [Ectobacillus ponti]|uniref:SIMPL domain-containing protein n=1 Tax=Ectobacillus ponti TaxID=2961894 RepID=A0AA41X1C9_9BACI|nr:SIMPL domain-containing protein [Ectobacillus ponti]MCP8966952.1 SIMPL domain-containing protein [Ectobacillus ponti]
MQFGLNPLQAYSSTARPANINVQGEGTATAKPDLVSLTIGVQTENLDVKAAQSENARLSNALLTALRTLGIPDQDIQTLSYTINPEYDYKDGAGTLQGYRVEHLFEIRVANVQRAGEVYAAAVQAGANVARGLSFRVSDPSVAYEQALTRAVNNARTKARTIAGTLGVKINAIPVSVTEVQTNAQRAVYAMQADAPPIQPGELNVTVIVEASFSYV